MKSRKLHSAVAFALMACSSFSALAADANVALGKATTASSIYLSAPLNTRFLSGNVVDGDILDATGADSLTNTSLWLSAAGTGAGQYVQVNLGESINISSISVIDTHNRGNNDRGTAGFKLSYSSDGISFSELATSTFSKNDWTYQTPLSFAANVTAQYVRFTATSVFYSLGTHVAASESSSSAGLSELQVFGSAAPVPEPETYAMLLAGLGLMGTIARRRKNKQA